MGVTRVQRWFNEHAVKSGTWPRWLHLHSSICAQYKQMSWTSSTDEVPLVAWLLTTSGLWLRLPSTQLTLLMGLLIVPKERLNISWKIKSFLSCLLCLTKNVLFEIGTVKLHTQILACLFHGMIGASDQWQHSVHSVNSWNGCCFPWYSPVEENFPLLERIQLSWGHGEQVNATLAEQQRGWTQSSVLWYIGNKARKMHLSVLCFPFSKMKCIIIFAAENQCPVGSCWRCSRAASHHWS